MKNIKTYEGFFGFLNRKKEETLRICPNQNLIDKVSEFISKDLSDLRELLYEITDEIEGSKEIDYYLLTNPNEKGNPLGASNWRRMIKSSSAGSGLKRIYSIGKEDVLKNKIQNLIGVDVSKIKGSLADNSIPVMDFIKRFNIQEVHFRIDIYFNKESEDLKQDIEENGNQKGNIITECMERIQDVYSFDKIKYGIKKLPFYVDDNTTNESILQLIFKF